MLIIWIVCYSNVYALITIIILEITDDVFRRTDKFNFMIVFKPSGVNHGPASLIQSRPIITWGR